MVALRIQDIKDVDIAKQVAQLAIAENDRLHKRLEAQAKRIAELTGESGAKQLEMELAIVAVSRRLSHLTNVHGETGAVDHQVHRFVAHVGNSELLA